MRNSAETPTLVKDLMTFDVQTLLPTDTINDARDRMYSWEGPFTVEVEPTILP